MGRTVSLKGVAAKAFMEGAMGKAPENDDDRLERVLTHIEMGLKDKSAAGRLSAKALLLMVARDGLAAACDTVTRR